MKTIYALIRVPKSGSTSLIRGMEAAVNPANSFLIPGINDFSQYDSFIDNLRAQRKKHKKSLKLYSTINEDKMWAHIDKTAQNSDIIHGHIAYGTPHLPSADIQYITIIRNPFKQFISQYNWVKKGYDSKNFFQKFYHFGRTKAAAKGLDYYLDFLNERQEWYSNPATFYVTGDRSFNKPDTFVKKNYFHYGTLEQLDTFVDNLKEKHNLEMTFPKRNTSKESADSIELNVQQKTKIEKLYGNDLTLWEGLSK